MERGRNAIVSALAGLNDRAGLIPFVVAGDPNFEDSIELLRILSEYADVIEIGIPYSDPLADGPAIQAGAARSLANGMNLSRAMDLISAVRTFSPVPIIAFTYANPVYKTGIAKFLSNARGAGADGVIIPDLPHEESEDLRRELDRLNMAYVPLVSLTSGERAARIAKTATGFVYCVSTLGVTGERKSFAAQLPALVSQVKASSTVPVAVGFGVSQTEQVAELSAYADGVIVGSAFVKYAGLLKNAAPEDRNVILQAFRRFASDLAGATNKGEKLG